MRQEELETIRDGMDSVSSLLRDCRASHPTLQELMTVTKEFLLPLHKHYYVGDIGYVLEDEDFSAVINQDPSTGVHTHKGHQFFLLTDGPGDGTFPMDDLTDLDDDDYAPGLSGFSVDCGTWGILPLEMLNQEWLEDELFKF